MFQLPIGKEYLELKIDNQMLDEKLQRWYRFPNNESDQFLGLVNISISTKDFSNFPDLPLVEWTGDICAFQAKGVFGRVGSDGSAELLVNQPFVLHSIEQFLRVVTAVQVFRRGGLLVHSAGLIRKGKGYLFSGYSGAGKTTVCRVSRDCQILNDDLVVLYPGDQKWDLGATPFSNPTQVPPGNGKGTLDMILFLKQAKSHAIRAIPFHSALSAFISHVPVVSAAPQFSSELFNRSLDILQNTEISELLFTPDDGFWELID